MAEVIFYEKPGCAGNARQKEILEAAGHTVVPRNLLAEPWTRARLLSFFAPLPVSQWFNRNSPAIKSGEIVPEELDEDWAMALLLAHPLLIRRPLLEVDGQRRVGFDPAVIDAWIGLDGQRFDEDLQACRHEAGHHCQGHEDGSEPCTH
jgi:nitrogenase-associated protein